VTVTHDPVYAQGLRSVSGTTTAAKSTLTDTTNAVKIFTAGANGSFVKRLRARPRATVSAANKLLLFRVSAGGATVTLIDSALMGAHTLADTTAIPETPFTTYSYLDPLRLGPSEELWAAQATALAGGIAWDGDAEDL
jgi:hypothetical protein